VTVANGFFGVDWLDSTTVVGTLNSDPLRQPPYPLAYVLTSAPGTAVPMGFTGLVIGTVRS
jgi:hypothetical protein